MHPSMRVGIDTRICHYSGGGIRKYTVRLVEGLAALDRETDYRVLHSRKDPSPLAPGLNFRPVSCWTPSHHPWERWAFAAEVARLRCDLLHSPDFIPPAFGYRRSVITVHDLNFLHYPQFLTAESRRYYNDQIEWAVARSDHILADSQATKEDLTRLLGVPSEKATVVHLAADPDCRPMPEAEVRTTLAGHGLEAGYVLFVGTLEPRKNVSGLLKAYRTVVDRDASAPPLVIAGSKGWLFRPIYEQAETLGLADRVRFLDRVPDPDLPALYNGARVLAIPSFYEGFGLPALEAMACGTPVIAADRASLPEVVGDAGLLIDPDRPISIAAALILVLSDGSVRARLGEAGITRAAQFSWARTAKETLAVYRRVAGM
jgi:glycosyltransferase involved in cell wall biosynthesis